MAQDILDFKVNIETQNAATAMENLGNQYESLKGKMERNKIKIQIDGISEIKSSIKEVNSLLNNIGKTSGKGAKIDLSKMFSLDQASFGKQMQQYFDKAIKDVKGRTKSSSSKDDALLAKLLAAEINQYQLEMFCDLLIGYAYSKAGAKKKAEIIFNDVLENSQKSAIFNTTVLAKYFIAQLKVEKSEIDEALQLVNECLAQLQKYNNRSKIIYVLFEKLFIEIVKSQEMENIDVDSEEQKLALATSGGKLARLIG